MTQPMAVMTMMDVYTILVRDVLDLGKPVVYRGLALYKSGNHFVDFVDMVSDVDVTILDSDIWINQVEETDTEIVLSDIYSDGRF